jgi:murein DD-endopeptidase MepM/ murein hydrolase activator NlpD
VALYYCDVGHAFAEGDQGDPPPDPSKEVTVTDIRVDAAPLAGGGYQVIATAGWSSPSGEGEPGPEPEPTPGPEPEPEPDPEPTPDPESEPPPPGKCADHARTYIDTSNEPYPLAGSIHTINPDCMHGILFDPPMDPSDAPQFLRPYYPEMRREAPANPNHQPYFVSVNEYHAGEVYDPAFERGGVIWIPNTVSGGKIDFDVMTVHDGTATNELSAALLVKARLPLPDIEIEMSPSTGMVNVPSWFWVDGYRGETLSRSETVSLTTGVTRGATGDCPPLLPVRDMRRNRSKPGGSAAILTAIVGQDLPVLWGWGSSYEGSGHGSATVGGRYYEYFHTGLDITLPQGTALKAPVDGSARSYWSEYGGGNMVEVRLRSGHSYVLMHMVRRGESGPIRAGEVVGYSGDTGNSGLPHVHVEMRGPNGAGYIAPEHWECLGGPAGRSISVAIRVSGTEYEWDFGDGAVESGTLGRAYPSESDVRHNYSESSLGGGDNAYETKLTITYGGRYSVDGAAFRRLPPQTETYREPYMVQEAQSVLTSP